MARRSGRTVENHLSDRRQKKTVEIHGVFDGRRSLEDVLMERILQA